MLLFGGSDGLPVTKSIDMGSMVRDGDGMGWGGDLTLDFRPMHPVVTHN